MVFLDINKAVRTDFEIETGYQPTSAVFYILNGSFKIKLREKWFEVKEGDVIYLPQKLYFERKVIKPIEFYYLRFSGDERYFHLGGILHIANFSYFESALHYILQTNGESKESAHMRNVFLESMFCQFLIDYSSLSQTDDTPIWKCIDYIKTNYDRDIDLDVLCRISGYSKTSLIQKFKEQCGTTPIRYINSIRIEKAKEYLINQRLMIAEIADKCGFGCPYYFSNTFKKLCGESPQKYRKEHLM